MSGLSELFWRVDELANYQVLSKQIGCAQEAVAAVSLISIFSSQLLAQHLALWIV